MTKLTKSAVDRALPARSRYTLFDDEVRGFGLRVFPSGRKSYILDYRPGAGGRDVSKKRIMLGVHGSDLTPDAARKEARAILSDVRRGNDPAALRRRSREMPTLRQFGEHFLAEASDAKLLKPRSVSNYGTLLKKHVFPFLGDTKLDAVSAADVRRLHRSMGKTQPTNANRMIAAVGAVYKFAAAEELLADDSNPARGIAKFKEAGRERFLTVTELQRLGVALRDGERSGLPWSAPIDSTKRSKHCRKPENRRTVLSVHETAAVRLLLFTGCRLREILNARWIDVDFQRGMLTLPDSKTGKRTVILSSAAVSVLHEHPRSGEYVIAGANPNKPRADLKRPWAAITKHAALDGLRLHDLRHTFASVGAAGGMDLPTIGKLLGHADPSVTQRYAHLADDQAKRATDIIAAGIAAAMIELPLITEA